jgi:hypothetical protein
VLLLLTGFLLLVFLRRRRRRQALVEPPLPDTRSPETKFSQIDPATMPLAKPPAVAPPPGIYPFNANGTDGLILVQYPHMPPVSEASDIPRVGVPQASIITRGQPSI